MSTDLKNVEAPASVFVLIEDSEDVAKFGGPKEIDVDTLGEQLRRFSEGMSRAISRCKSLGGEFDLTEVTIEAKLTAEFGFALVSKAGVEGTITLKFVRGKT